MRFLLLANNMLSDKNYQRLVKAAPMIIKHLKPMFILDKLLSLGALHQYEIEDIKTEGARWRKCELLCEYLRHGSEQSFQRFMETLKESGQRHIAAAILDEQDIAGMQWFIHNWYVCRCVCFCCGNCF